MRFMTIPTTHDFVFSCLLQLLFSQRPCRLLYCILLIPPLLRWASLDGASFLPFGLVGWRMGDLEDVNVEKDMR